MTYLTEAQVAQFEEQGYLIVENLLDPVTALDPIIKEYEEVLNDLAWELYTAGKLSSPYGELPFGQRLIRVYAETGRAFTQNFDFCLPLSGVTIDTPIWLGPAVFDVIRNEKLLDVVESLIGPELYSNPIQHVRLKTPEHLSPKDPETGRSLVVNAMWHQDNGVILPEADETNLLTVWFPLVDATVANGCLQLVPYSHRAGLLQHCPQDGLLQIPEKYFDRDAAMPVPMKRGSVLFMHRRTCHASLINHSNEVRWSFDLRYNPIGQPTGRDLFPGFVARSRSQPETELRDPQVWAEMWYETRRKLAGQPDPTYKRWSYDAELCA